jgi:hypothetical protein
MVWDKEKIKQLILTNDEAVERGMVAIYRRQTQDEKQVKATKHNNTIGFSSAHSRLGSYYAQWVLSGKHLTGYHLVKARKMMMHYSRQLVEVANQKAS